MIFEQILVASVVVGAAMVIMDIIGASLYEIKRVTRFKQRQRHPYARRYLHRPLLSVVVFAGNDALVIERCLKSLVQSSYRKLEIIVVNNTSSDKTKQIVKHFMAAHPKKAVRLYSKRGRTTDIGALQRVYKKYVHGELIMILDAHQFVNKQALTRAMAHFNDEPDLGSLSLNGTVHTKYSIVGLFQRFEQLLSYRSKQSTSVFNSEYTAPSDGAVYASRILGKLLQLSKQQPMTTLPVGLSMLKIGNKQTQARYARDVVVYREPLPSLWSFLQHRYRLQMSRLSTLFHYRRLLFRFSPDYTKFLTCFRLPFALVIGITALFVPVLVTYFTYLALSLHQPMLLIGASAAFTVLVVSTIWGDEQLRLRQKLSYGALVPITYGLFYVLSFIQLFVVLGGALKSPTLLLPKSFKH